jgi:hypothetical protein
MTPLLAVEEERARSAGVYFAVRPIALSACLLAALLSSGCLVLALQPAYNTESVVFDEALVGEWENADDGTSTTIERREWRAYKVSYADRFATRSFQGNLTRIGAATFLDLTEMRGVDPGPFLLPVHGVLQVSVSGDTLTAALLDYNWFMRAMNRKSLGIITAAVDDRHNAVVTSPTGELRRWLLRAPAEAFGALMTFTKKREIADF